MNNQIIFNQKQQIGSSTAKGGFDNEKAIADKFNNYKNDDNAKQWLNQMGYNYHQIQQLIAIQIPIRINKNTVKKLGINDEQFTLTQKYKKADIQIQLTITVNNIIYRENISLKKANLSSNFNQIDKRAVDTYQQMWGFDDTLAVLLKKFTGEVQPTPEQSQTLKDKRRWYLNELSNTEQQLILDFFRQNKYLVVSDILKGRGMLSAEWFLVTKVNGNKITYCLKNINEVINFYAQGEVKLSTQSGLVISKLTAQRKGGTPDPTSLQFKIQPLAIFEST